MTDFTGKVAIVTGAGQGIGEAYAHGLSAVGAAVVVADINVDAGRRVAGDIHAKGGKVAFVEVDVASPESAERLANATVQSFGGIDFLVNNAVIFAGKRKEGLLTVDLDYYRRFMAVNADGAAPRSTR